MLQSVVIIRLRQLKQIQLTSLTAQSNLLPRSGFHHRTIGVSEQSLILTTNIIWIESIIHDHGTPVSCHRQWHIHSTPTLINTQDRNGPHRHDQWTQPTIPQGNVWWTDCNRPSSDGSAYASAFRRRTHLRPSHSKASVGLYESHALHHAQTVHPERDSALSNGLCRWLLPCQLQAEKCRIAV